jgi:hypothetical protein
MDKSIEFICRQSLLINTLSILSQYYNYYHVSVVDDDDYYHVIYTNHHYHDYDHCHDVDIIILMMFNKTT